MPIFLLIRHGDNDYVKGERLAGRLPGVHLNQKGLCQAKELADKLGALPIKAVYTSPLERAIETARPIALRFSLEPVTRMGLVEVDIGEWQGVEIKSLRRKKIWKRVQTTPSQMRFPGGETFYEAQARICDELLVIADSHGEKDLVVCVSHSDPIKLAVAYHLGMGLDQFQRLNISTASITALQVGKRGTRLIGLNMTCLHNLIAK